MPVQLPSEGLYRGVVRDSYLSRSGKNHDGTYCWVTVWRVTHKFRDEDDPESITELEQPICRTCYGYLTQKTVDRVIEEIQHLVQLPPEEQPNFLRLDNVLSVGDPYDLIGKESNLLCKHEEYQGKTRDKWSISRRANKVRLNPDDAAALQELFGDRFKARQDEQRESATEYFAKLAAGRERQVVNPNEVGYLSL